MRFLVTATIPSESPATVDELRTTMQFAMARLRPEAAYFVEEHGARECIFVFDLDVPALLRPLFGDLPVSLHATPALTATEFQQRLQEVRQPAPEPELLDDLDPRREPGPDEDEDVTERWETDEEDVARPV